MTQERENLVLGDQLLLSLLPHDYFCAPVFSFRCTPILHDNRLHWFLIARLDFAEDSRFTAMSWSGWAAVTDLLPITVC